MSEKNRQFEQARGAARLDVPESLKHQLRDFRGYVWGTKVAEAVALASVVLLLAFLTVYFCDRCFDTPAGARFTMFLLAIGLWGVVPWAVHRWVWKNRRLEQVARLLRMREPSVGDQLLSVIELAGNDSEQARSRNLCEAAIRQVAEVASQRDLKKAAPSTRLRPLLLLLLTSSIATLTIAGLFPAAARNAWARFASPWHATPRYTFTSLVPLPKILVVPHGEIYSLELELEESSPWVPDTAQVQVGVFPPLEASNDGGVYRFELPPQIEASQLTVNVGDYSQTVNLLPKVRPEIVSAVASIQLPEYLQREAISEQDVRSGTLSGVVGSYAHVQLAASRSLATASVDGKRVDVEEDSFQTPSFQLMDGPQKTIFEWADRDGLGGKMPFELAINSMVDEPPSVVAQDLPRQAIVLETEQINFKALAADDFGVKRIGMQWQGVDETLVAQPAQGEKTIAAGDPQFSSLQVPATFNAKSLGISSQPIELRLWVEDYLPGRERTYSPTHLLYVLTEAEHAIWVTNQMSKWHRAALDVRDQEMQLFEANKRLRGLSAEELSDEAMREELRTQAALEESNGRRLNSLSASGEELLKQAARNSEVAVENLNQWAEMLTVLHDIGKNRMPNVADLLDQAADSKRLARPGNDSARKSAPQAGQMRANPAQGAQEPAAEEDGEEKDRPVVPSVTDIESSLQGQDPSDPPDASKKPERETKPKSGAGRLGLPETTLIGPEKRQEEEEESAVEEESIVDQAIDEQSELLAEFERISDELNTVLANLEGSTLVKRLKAASREQSLVAEKISSRIAAMFGRKEVLDEQDLQVLSDLAEVESNSCQAISFIMDDMQSFYERRRMEQFKFVLDDMKSSEVLIALQGLSEDVVAEQGLSIAQAEYWADTLDRWAEDLVDSPDGGKKKDEKKDGQSNESLPPTLILEMLKILEGEVNLREETRVAEQARPALELAVHERESQRLSQIQDGLRVRTDALVDEIAAMPSAEENFGAEIALLAEVSQIMDEAKQLLGFNSTAGPTLAAETEAIELLLQSKRINPKAAGGAPGASPGGGGTGTTTESALALIGSGINQNEQRETRDVTQAIGESGRVLPEEFRGGLDAYFNQLERNR